MMDLPFPTLVCVCGSQMWRPKWIIWNEEGEVAAYSDRQECAVCGTWAESPMPGVNWGLDSLA